MAGQGIVGIIAPGIRLQSDTSDAVGGLEGADRIGGLPLHLPRSRHIPGAGLAGLFQQLLIVQIQDPAQFPGNQFPVLAVLPDLGRAEINVVHRGADGQEPSPGVGDAAPARGAWRLPQLLLQGPDLLLNGRGVHPLADLLPHHGGKGRILHQLGNDLRHRADGGIVHDRFHAGNLEGLVLLAGTHQHGAGLETRALLQHLIYADTNGAETQYCNFHCVSSSLHVRKSGTYVFRTATV